jgi:hypothetical protein
MNPTTAWALAEAGFIQRTRVTVASHLRSCRMPASPAVFPSHQAPAWSGLFVSRTPTRCPRTMGKRTCPRTCGVCRNGGNDWGDLAGYPASCWLPYKLKQCSAEQYGGGARKPRLGKARRGTKWGTSDPERPGSSVALKPRKTLGLVPRSASENHLGQTRNEGVRGSSPRVGFTQKPRKTRGFLSA